MKKMRNPIRKTIMCLLLSLVMISGAAAGIPFSRPMSDHMVDAVSTATQTTKAWTLLFYDDVDWGTAGSPDPLPKFISGKAFSGTNLTVIVLQDTLNDQAKLWRIDENHTPILLDEMGELNMGDPSTLKDFISTGKTQYPAERYVLMVYDHGKGWMGACIDKTSNNDSLTMNEFHQALDDSGGVDIICFSAPCCMGSLEAAYELRDVVKVYIGSEDLGYYLHWPGTMDDICTLLNKKSSLSLVDIGAEIITIVKENPEGQLKNKLTLSALRTDRITDVAVAVDALSKELLKKWFLSSFKKVKTARENTFELAENYAETEQLVDLTELAENLNWTASADKVLDALNQTIIAEYHSSEKHRAYGVSIFFPTDVMETRNTFYYTRRSYGLDFAKDTFWNEFIILYILTNRILG
jgi:hypothetical protein